MSTFNTIVENIVPGYFPFFNLGECGILTDHHMERFWCIPVDIEIFKPQMHSKTKSVSFVKQRNNIQ